MINPHSLRAEMVCFYTEVSVEIKLHPSGGYQVCDYSVPL